MQAKSERTKKRRWSAQQKQIVRAAKDRPCTDCGKRFPYFVMDLDHVRGKKQFELAHGYRVSAARLLLEISKCEPVCSNCHRVRTFNRRAAGDLKP